jgi:hypothetical protein
MVMVITLTPDLETALNVGRRPTGLRPANDMRRFGDLPDIVHV